MPPSYGDRDPGRGLQPRSSGTRATIPLVLPAASVKKPTQCTLMVDAIDGGAAHAVGTFDTTSGRPVVEAATAPLAPARARPHLIRVAAYATSVVFTFDSDLDPASVTGAIVITGADGRRIPEALLYDPTTKAVTAPGQFGNAVRVDVTGRIKDIRGRSLVPFGALIDATPNPA